MARLGRLPRGTSRRHLCRARGLAAIALSLLAACTSSPVGSPSPSPTIDPAPTPSPSPSPLPVTTFSVENVMHTIDVLATEIGPREAVTAAYRRAVAYVRAQIASAG